MPSLLRLYGCAAIAVVVVLCSPVTAGAQSNDQKVEAAKQTAQEWLALLDADKYKATWKASAPSFKAGMTAEQWAERLRQAHSTLDTLTSRTLVTARHTTSLPNPNAPDGEYAVVQYRATYGARDVSETMLLSFEDGEWGHVGYYVRPRQ